MSHSVDTAIPSSVGHGIYGVTIINYAVGGETFLPSDFSVSTVINVVMGTIPASQNSLAVPLFPVLDAGKVKLFRFTSGSPVEIAATTNLNAHFSVVIGFS